MGKIRDTLHFYLEYSTEDEDYGPVYVASCVELAIVTDGKTVDETLRNIGEAVSLHLEDVDTVAEYNLTPNPRLVITLELPESYAQTA